MSAIRFKIGRSMAVSNVPGEMTYQFAHRGMFRTWIAQIPLDRINTVRDMLEAVFHARHQPRLHGGDVAFRRLRAKPDKKIVDHQAAIPSS